MNSLNDGLSIRCGDRDLYRYRLLKRELQNLLRNTGSYHILSGTCNSKQTVN